MSGARPNSSLRLGDIVRIPIDENRVGYAQVVGDEEPNPPYLAIFASAYPTAGQPGPEQIVLDEIRFLALTFDALVADGTWKVVGNVTVSQEIPRPKFKVAVGPAAVWHVESFDATQSRPASAEEATLLPFRRAYAPIVVQDALQASHGVGPWRDGYKAIEYDRVRRWSEVEL